MVTVLDLLESVDLLLLSNFIILSSCVIGVTSGHMGHQVSGPMIQ